MANTLTGTIRILTPGVKEAFATVQTGVVKTEASLKSIGPTASNSFGKLSGAVSKSSSALRSLANIIPGLGIGGLVLAVGSLATELFNAAGGFSKVELAAAAFDAQLKRTKERIDEFNDAIDFKSKLQKLQNELSGLTGNALALANAGVDINKGGEQIKQLTGEIEKLTNQNKNLVETRVEFEKVVQSMGSGSTKLAKLLSQPGGLDNLSDGLVKNLNKADQEIVRQYKKTNEEIKSLTDKRKEVLQSTILTTVGLPLLVKKDKPVTQKVDKVQIIPKEAEIIQRVPFKIANGGALQLDKIKIELLGETVIPLTFAQQVAKNIEEGLEKLVIAPDLNISLKGIMTPEELEAMNDQLRGLADTIAGIVTPAFDGFFDAVANGGNAFQAFAQAAGQALVEVIKKLAVAAILSLILSSITGGGAAIGAASGKFTDIFKFLAGFGGARAGGGPVSAGKGYIVGENGPEWFKPNTGGAITPNNQLGGRGAFTNGGMQLQVSGQFIQRGTDLVAVIALANQSKNRLV